MLLPIVVLSAWDLAWAQASPPGEYELKAAFLFNFAKFVDWPQSDFAHSQSPFEICVLGKDPFGHVLDDALLNKQIANRTVPLDMGSNKSTKDAIDLAATLERLDGDRNLFQELGQLFRGDCPTIVERMRRAIVMQDAKSLEDCAHTLKGSVANPGALAVSHAAGEIKRAGSHGEGRKHECRVRALAGNT